MDLDYTDEQQAFRQEVRSWLEKHVPSKPLPSFDASREGFEAHRAWERVLAEGRWGMVTWPESYGGRGLDLIQWLIFEEEYYRAGAPLRVNQNGIFLLGPTLMEYGTEEQKARFLTSMASGDEIWAQAWSEPQAGSDLASVRATAVLEGDEYVLKGHKIWSSRAVFADWAFGLFRTDPASQRHKGLSLIFFPLNAPGVRVQAIPQIDGETGFAEIFLDDVRVSAFNRLGGEGEGWNICMATAGFERGLMLRSPARFQVAARKLVELYKAHEAEVEPTVRTAVLQSWMDAEAYALSIYATASRLAAGGHIGAEASTNKIFWSEMDIAMHKAALSILGARAELLRTAPEAGDIGRWLDGYFFSLAGPIYAGSNEIQRNIIAERMLGLPRA
ncbi:acyl-CoA dehydrogenase family protein [Aminobacter sp. NyZ550]|uniref:Alkylation response protein AidB-like acyl-CoA dehydrogenase n=1 Tax=Aminobacter ciceronei TaxID=150723 RepID=A0ABR6C693_9HYPH|nr:MULTISPECIES: acyl-CoA dehydrogenase family protein [Aminobacter]MBA8906745.1 alkylation response protein AidB-like acyl-CoA dehydrogenase [Aminobacter ciceronei]MBA9020524.1 alkylation response protein AidB-like acyl-CoA dehydrogenase [Aminobacter ciceronei]MRX37303.1 acyl-CoA dehydrogenase [Aminobacter sp. MDW-2]QNH32671.1 acyl-CoA dehydrogenase family protein [Aminobacter sp. MDW-2]WAX93569.1 acyl-CoA dehydrogenase family protein [Aminobacter sp. NyZ550]